MSGRVDRESSPTDESLKPARDSPLAPEQRKTDACGRRTLCRRRLDFNTPPRAVTKTPSPPRKREKKETPETCFPEDRNLEMWFENNFGGPPPLPPDISPIRPGTEDFLDEPWDPRMHQTCLDEIPSIEEMLSNTFFLNNKMQCLQILCQFEDGEEIPSADEFFSYAVDREWWQSAQLLANHVSETFNDESTMTLCMLGEHTEIVSTVLQRSKAVRDTAFNYLFNMEKLRIDFPEIRDLFFVVSQLSVAIQSGNQKVCSEGLQMQLPVIPGADGFFAETVRLGWWLEAEQLAHHISGKFENEETIGFCIAEDKVEILATILARSAVARGKIDVYLRALEKRDTVNEEIRNLFLQYQIENQTHTGKLMESPSPSPRLIGQLPVDFPTERGFTPPPPTDEQKTLGKNRVYSTLTE